MATTLVAQKAFDWIRPGYELVTVKLEWNVQVPFLNTTDGEGETLESPLFSPEETPNSKWQLQVGDGSHSLRIYACHCTSTAGGYSNFVEPALVEMLIRNNRRQKVFQKMVSSAPTISYVEFAYSKLDLVKCQQSDGSLTFYCKILTHVKQETEPSADPSSLAIDCSGGLSNHLEELFNSMQSSDVIFKVRGRDCPAHKSILVDRSDVFAAMFQHSMEENLTNQIEIEDIEPEVFQELLRFIYTGKVPLEKLETMVADLFIAADKYVMNELKMKCENYMRNQMSPDNCIVLLWHGDLQNPAEPSKEAAKFFRRFPNEVMASERWKKMKQKYPALLCEILEFMLRKK
jgi:speckle-type POZ protein